MTNDALAETPADTPGKSPGDMANDALAETPDDTPGKSPDKKLGDAQDDKISIAYHWRCDSLRLTNVALYNAAPSNSLLRFHRNCVS